MSFDTTARQRVAPGAEEQDMPACLPLVSFLGDERAGMKLAAEAETEVFLSKEGGVSVTQSCSATGDTHLVYFVSADRVRAVANEMLRLAEVIDAGDAVAHDTHAMPVGQRLEGHGQLADLLRAAQHQVGQRAGDKAVIGFDQRDLDAPLGPHADVLGGGGAAIAPADDDHLGARCAAGAGAASGESAEKDASPPAL